MRSKSETLREAISKAIMGYEGEYAFRHCKVKLVKQSNNVEVHMMHAAIDGHRLCFEDYDSFACSISSGIMSIVQAIEMNYTKNKLDLAANDMKVMQRLHEIADLAMVDASKLDLFMRGK